MPSEGRSLACHPRALTLLGALIIVSGVLWNLRTGAARPH